MIVLKLELHSARTGQVTTLGQAVIINDGSGTNAHGNYDCLVANKKSKDKLPALITGSDILRYGRVEKYPRLSYNVWRLVIRGLLSAFPEEKTK